MIYPFLSLPFWPGSGQGKNMRIRADPDPKHRLRLHKYVEHYLFKIKKKKLADSKYVT